MQCNGQLCYLYIIVFYDAFEYNIFTHSKFIFLITVSIESLFILMFYLMCICRLFFQSNWVLLSLTKMRKRQVV